MDNTRQDILIGIDVGGSFIKAGLITCSGRVLARLEPQPTVDGPGAVETSLRMAESLRQQALGEGLRLVGIGLSTCGVVDPRRGIVLESTSVAGYGGTPWLEKLSRFDLPAAVENDARASAWAEYTLRLEREVQDWIHVPVGTSLGCGIILGGRLWRGSSFSAGEIGHITVEAQGSACACGNVGCLEDYVSKEAVLSYIHTELEKGSPAAQASRLLKGEIDLPAVIAAGKAGDSLAVQALQRTGRYLGIGLTTLTNLFNPEVISVGGGVIEASAALLEAAREHVITHALSSATRSLVVKKGQLGNDAGFIGAALLACQGDEIGSATLDD